MNINLPEPIAAYFAAEKLNGEAVARCFTNRAIVKDDGHTYTGLAAIKRWKADAAAKFQYAIEPLSSEQQNGTTVVMSRLTGNFPGSPVTLQFLFRLERGKIASLEIIP
jgi:hypothetical protein